MIYGVGTDLIEIVRVLKACERESFAARVFTEQERREASGHKLRLAGDFAVKEAVAKALGTGFRSFGPADIEVLRDDAGRPYVRLHNAAAEYAEQVGIMTVHVSITDTDTLVSAFAVAEK